MARRSSASDEIALKAMGIAIKNLRERAGLSQRELARRAALTPAWLSHIEAGNAEALWGTLSKLAAGIGTPLSDLIKECERVEAARDG